MKTILFLIAAGVAFYFHYNDRLRKPEVFTNPSYAEMRMDVDASGKKVELVLFARMKDESECRESTEETWKQLVERCRECTFKLVSCKETLIPRYAMLFDNEQISVTYLSLARGSRNEREGRIIFWGVTRQDSGLLCNMVQPILEKRRTGAVTCVRAHTS